MKFAKKSISLLLTVVMLLSVVSIVPITTQAASGVADKIAKIRNVYNTGSYFTASGKACNSSQADDCYLPNIPSRGGLPSGATVAKATGNYGWSCFSFAVYAFYNIFGCSYQNSTTVNVSNAQIGDFIHLYSKYGNHYGIYLGQDSNNYYIYDSNGVLPICNMVTYNKYVYIPEKINGYTIVDICGYTEDGVTVGAFEFNSNVEEVTVSGEIVSIGDYSFAGCFNLQCINIKSDLRYIGEYAFASCSLLNGIQIPATVYYIGDFAYGYDHGGNKMTYNEYNINSYSGTAAEKYAYNYNIAFRAMDYNTSIRGIDNKMLYVKEKLKVNPKIFDGYGVTTFKSSNPKIAKINAKGKITAKKSGEVTIYVTNNGCTESFTVTVMNPQLSTDVLEFYSGNSYKLKIYGKVGKAAFKSSNTKVATVNSKGKIVAKKKGKATITVKTNGITLKCKVKVI